MARSTVSRILSRLGLGRLWRVLEAEARHSAPSTSSPVVAYTSMRRSSGERADRASDPR